MVDPRILSQFDQSAYYAEAVALRVLIALFTALTIVLSLLFSIAITAVILMFFIVRATLAYVLSRRETRATFAALSPGGC